jgi:hypothetical protein
MIGAVPPLPPKLEWHAEKINNFLGAFANLEKRLTESSFMCVRLSGCLSVRMTDFYKT